MLEPVPLLEKDLDIYAVVAGEETVERIQKLAAPLRGARVLHINATAYGGGVAENLATQVALLRAAGLDAHWRLIGGTSAFFVATKAIHNALQGMGEVEWTVAIQNAYLEHARGTVDRLEAGWDFVVVHDPQPLPLLSSLEKTRDGARWIWRCHIDCTTPRQEAADFVGPLIAPYDATVWTMEAFVPDWPTLPHVEIFPPAIDPLVPKNLELGNPFLQRVCRHFGIDPFRPILCQVSRYDPWKDPIGVIEAFRIARAQVPGVQLVLVGSMAADDPEALQYWEATKAAKDGDPDIHLLADVQDLAINALQTSASVVIQKSLREGFGLTVSEALWKGTPVIGGRAGGITLQVEDGVSGFLVSSAEECAERMVQLLTNPASAEEMGAQGRELVRERFLATRELEDYLRLLTALNQKTVP